MGDVSGADWVAPLGGLVMGLVEPGGVSELVWVGSSHGIIVAGGMAVPLELWQQVDASFPQQYSRSP